MYDINKWLRIRKDLYLQLERQVRHRLGEDTPELMQYHKVYQAEFSKRWSISSQKDLWSEIDRSQVVIVGDFHALHQSQKAQVRILRNAPKKRKKILAIEFIDAADQDTLDKFMAGRLSEKDFLKKTNWSERWGFPWENYRPLLRWAQKHKVPVVAINKIYKKRNANTLKARDIFAGKKIAEIVKSSPDSLVYVIFGDLHLAASHIPQEIVKNLEPSFSKKILRIFQNSEKIYFKLLSQDLDLSTDLVRLSEKAFCLMSVPPWVKWQNYLMFLEQTYDVELEGLDYTDHVGRYVKLISEELGIPLSTDMLSVYTARDHAFWNKLHEFFDGRQLRWIENLIAEGKSFYLPEIDAAYLARASVNHAASLAMQFIHAQTSQRKKSFLEVPKDFLQLIWIEAIAYLGSKMINPKRKTDTIADIKASLASRGPVELGKEALQLALAQKMHEMMTITRSASSRSLAKTYKKWSYVLAAHLLGGMMGERLYNGYRNKMLSSQSLVSLLSKSLENKNFKMAYFEIVEVVESLPAAFRSKKEKL